MWSDGESCNLSLLYKCLMLNLLNSQKRPCVERTTRPT